MGDLVVVSEVVLGEVVFVLEFVDSIVVESSVVDVDSVVDSVVVSEVVL